MTDDFDRGVYNLRLLIEQMQRTRSSEREIEMALREATGCPIENGQRRPD